MSNSHVAIEDQSFDVLNTTPSSYKIKSTGIGATFSTSDTLPNGFTLSSNGTLTYDGTNSDTGYFPFTVTVTKGEESATATITINLGVYEYTSVIFAAGVDTSIYFYNNNGVFTVSTDGGWGGTGYHQDLRTNYPWYSLYPKHGCKYSLDGGVTWNAWIFEDTNSTLDLSYTGLTSTTSFLKVLGRNSCYPSVNNSVYINDPSGGSAPYRFKLTSQRFVVSDESSSSSSSSLSKVPTDYDWYTPFNVDYVESVSGIAGTPAQSSAFSIATDNSKFGSGYLQVHKTTSDNTGLEYLNTTGMFKYGSSSFAVSYWIRTPYWNNYSQVVLGNKQGDRTTGFVIFKDYYDTMDMRAGANQINLKSPVVAGIADWHHYVFQRVTGGNWAWYKDGVLATSGTGATGNVTQSVQNFKVAGIKNWSKQAYFDLAHVRIYGRALNGEEITALAQEL